MTMRQDGPRGQLHSRQDVNDEMYENQGLATQTLHKCLSLIKPEARAAATALPCIIELPLVGIVSAGSPIETFLLPDAIEVPSSMAGSGNVVYEVRGDSMVEMGIMNGDFVIIHPQPVAENGQTVIADVNGATTIKKLVRKAGRIELHPFNSAMQPILVCETDEFFIRGILVGAMRLYRRPK